jgi:hypothetical protein
LCCYYIDWVVPINAPVFVIYLRMVIPRIQ